MPLKSSSFHPLAVVLSILLGHAIPAAGEPPACLAVYREGGAPAVLQSPECPRWSLSGRGSPSPAGARCQVSSLQGRRRYQEDRTVCALDTRVPFPDERGLGDVTVGLAAVFDGHGGAEASEMASDLLLDYFLLHTYFLLDSKFPGQLTDKGESDLVRESEVFLRVMTSRTVNFGHPYRLEILKEALLRTLHDIDAEFSKEALRSKLYAGSTAAVILMADEKVLVANIGDSKALLCSEKFRYPEGARDSLTGSRHLSVKELTRDHHPDRDDERSRVEAAGGFVLVLHGVPRVNGQLAVSRAIGDVMYKSSGVTAVPEVTDWQSLDTSDSYLVAASDGVFEAVSPQEVCDILWEEQSRGDSRSGRWSPSQSHNLADHIVKTAYRKGSWDNLSSVVVPLRSTLLSRDAEEDSCPASAFPNYTSS